jgi:hypothetical protein
MFARTMSDRAEKRTVFSPVKLQVQRRSGHFDVIQLPDTLPNISAKYRWNISTGW